MQTGAKLAIGATLVLVMAAGSEVLYIHHERNTDLPAAKTAAAYKVDPDDNVFIRKLHADTFKDMKDLKGKPLWVSAAGQMDYYPYVGHKVDFSKTQGVLLGAEKINVVDAIEQVAPAKSAIRIPTGDRQVLLVFTKQDGPTQYATPVGFYKDGGYTLETDEIYFYDDPHQLFNYWSPQIWQAIDAHKAIEGMNERQAMLALGQVTTPHGDNPGDRSVDFYNNGKGETITFVGGKATKIVASQ